MDDVRLGREFAAAQMGCESDRKIDLYCGKNSRAQMREGILLEEWLEVSVLPQAMEQIPNSAILVCAIPYGDANAQVVNRRLLDYNPVHLAADGSLKVMWDSQRWGVQFLYNKFDPPVIDGGQIFLANYNGGVDL
jgi:hypothetical protein